MKKSKVIHNINFGIKDLDKDPIDWIKMFIPELEVIYEGELSNDDIKKSFCKYMIEHDSPATKLVLKSYENLVIMSVGAEILSTKPREINITELELACDERYFEKYDNILLNFDKCICTSRPYYKDNKWIIKVVPYDKNNTAIFDSCTLPELHELNGK